MLVQALQQLTPPDEVGTNPAHLRHTGEVLRQREVTMQRSRFDNLRRTVGVVALLLTAAPSAWAQSITEAGRVEFTPSTDHSAVDPSSGAALVQSYSLQIFVAGASTAVQTVSLGKPTPQSDGMIRVDFVSLLSTPLTPAVVYESVVSAVGPGG